MKLFVHVLAVFTGVVNAATAWYDKPYLTVPRVASREAVLNAHRKLNLIDKDGNPICSYRTMYVEPANVKAVSVVQPANEKGKAQLELERKYAQRRQGFLLGFGTACILIADAIWIAGAIGAFAR